MRVKILEKIREFKNDLQNLQQIDEEIISEITVHCDYVNKSENSLDFNNNSIKSINYEKNLNANNNYIEEIEEEIEILDDNKFCKKMRYEKMKEEKTGELRIIYLFRKILYSYSL